MKTTHRVVVMAATGLLVLPLSRLVYSCFGGQYDSVHFNSAMPDFVAPPPALEIAGWKEEKSGRNSDYLSGDWQTEQEYERAKKQRALATNMARCAEQCGHFSEAIPLWRKALEDPEKNGFFVDRVEVLARAKQTSPKLVQTYLNATAATELPNEVATEVTAKSRKQLFGLYQNKKAGFLRAHALYAFAGERSGDPLMDSRMYERVAREFPDSPRAEAALIMSARRLLEEKGSWRDDKYDKAAIARCRALLSELLMRYPKTRFRANAIGWAARVEYVMGRYAAAEKLYYRQLAATKKYEDRYGVYLSIAECRAKMRDNAGAMIAWLSYARGAQDKYDYAWAFLELDTHQKALSKAEVERVARRMIARPELISVYLDFRLYLQDVSPTETRELLAFADKAFQKHSNAPVAPQICARIAELHYLNGNPTQAGVWARRAWSKGKKLSDRADLALYLQGTLARRRGDYAEAANSLTKLVRLFPRSYLVGGARENLALVYEATGKLDKALDEYYALDYEDDMAYILDAKMSTEQVRRYAESRRSTFNELYSPYFSADYPDYDFPQPSYTFGDVVRYSLGVRLLRDFKLDKARAVFQQFPAAKLRKLSHEEGDWWSEEDHRILHNPLNTIHDLKFRQQQIAKAETYEDKADANYALAAYIYNNRDLLFYNLPLWSGSRQFSFDFYYNKDIAKPADTKAVRAHHYQHECLNQARTLFVQIADKWPKSEAAPKALYSAACATGRLADMNNWWRLEDERVHLSRKSTALMRRLAEDYPTHALAKHAAKYAKEWETKPNW